MRLPFLPLMAELRVKCRRAKLGSSRGPALIQTDEAFENDPSVGRILSTPPIGTRIPIGGHHNKQLQVVAKITTLVILYHEISHLAGEWQF